MAYFDLRNANLPATHCVQTHAAGAIRMMITDIEPINCGSIKKLRKILPDFDQDKVLVSDIKKLIKWFNFLNERSLLELSAVEEVLEEEEE